jgi:hypothetical protein
MAALLRLLAYFILGTTAVVAAVQFSSKSWPQTVGTITSGRWAMEDGMPSSARGRYLVEYQFQVDGQEHRGSRIGFADHGSVVHLLNEKEDRQPREGDTVMVAYAPFWPDFCMLSPGAAPSLPLWSLVAVLVSLILWIYARISLNPVM